MLLLPLTGIINSLFGLTPRRFLPSTSSQKDWLRPYLLPTNDPIFSFTTISCRRSATLTTAIRTAFGRRGPRRLRLRTAFKMNGCFAPTSEGKAREALSLPPVSHPRATREPKSRSVVFPVVFGKNLRRCPRKGSARNLLRLGRPPLPGSPTPITSLETFGRNIARGRAVKGANKGESASKSTALTPRLQRG